MAGRLQKHTDVSGPLAQSWRSMRALVACLEQSTDSQIRPQLLGARITGRPRVPWPSQRCQFFRFTCCARLQGAAHAPFTNDERGPLPCLGAFMGHKGMREILPAWSLPCPAPCCWEHCCWAHMSPHRVSRCCRLLPRRPSPSQCLPRLRLLSRRLSNLRRHPSILRQRLLSRRPVNPARWNPLPPNPHLSSRRFPPHLPGLRLLLNPPPRPRLRS